MKKHIKLGTKITVHGTYLVIEKFENKGGIEN